MNSEEVLLRFEAVNEERELIAEAARQVQIQKQKNDVINAAKDDVSGLESVVENMTMKWREI